MKWVQNKRLTLYSKIIYFLKQISFNTFDSITFASLSFRTEFLFNINLLTWTCELHLPFWVKVIWVCPVVFISVKGPNICLYAHAFRDCYTLVCPSFSSFSCDNPRNVLYPTDLKNIINPMAFHKSFFSMCTHTRHMCECVKHTHTFVWRILNDNG